MGVELVVEGRVELVVEGRVELGRVELVVEGDVEHQAVELVVEGDVEHQAVELVVEGRVDHRAVEVEQRRRAAGEQGHKREVFHGLILRAGAVKMGRKSDAHEGEHLNTWGWGVRLDDPRAWLAPEGERAEPFWWGKRGDAERLALRYGGLGRGVAIVHCSRKRSCTSPALDPWDTGYDSKKHTAMCGRSLVLEVVPNATAARDAERARRAHERELRAAAKSDALWRARELREKKARDPFGAMPGHTGTAAALLELARARGALSTDRQAAAVAYLMRTHSQARDGLLVDGELSPSWLRDEICTLASDVMSSDPPLARKLLKASGRGICRTAEAQKERRKVEKKKATERTKAADRVRGLKGKRR